MRRLACGVVTLLALTGCHRETRDFSNAMMNRADRGAAYKGNAWHVAQGQRLYVWMNCAGCHSHGGGGMGPPLRDAKWRYGSSMDNIVATILNGRLNGMPAFRYRITEDQAYELAAYVTSLSARVREDVLPGRGDEPANVEPPPLDERKTPRAVTGQQDAAQLKQDTK